MHATTAHGAEQGHSLLTSSLRTTHLEDGLRRLLLTTSHCPDWGKAPPACPRTLNRPNYSLRQRPPASLPSAPSTQLSIQTQACDGSSHDAAVFEELPSDTRRGLRGSVTAEAPQPQFGFSEAPCVPRAAASRSARQHRGCPRAGPAPGCPRPGHAGGGPEGASASGQGGGAVTPRGRLHGDPRPGDSASGATPSLRAPRGLWGTPDTPQPGRPGPQPCPSLGGANAARCPWSKCLFKSGWNQESWLKSPSRTCWEPG